MPIRRRAIGVSGLVLISFSCIFNLAYPYLPLKLDAWKIPIFGDTPKVSLLVIATGTILAFGAIKRERM